MTLSTQLREAAGRNAGNISASSEMLALCTQANILALLDRLERCEKALGHARSIIGVRVGDLNALGADVWMGSDDFPRSRPFTDILCEEIDAALQED